MSYIIKTTEVLEETINTDVEYTFSDGTVELIRVSHFMPESMEEVIQNIEQRELSEQTKINAIKRNKIISNQLEQAIIVPVKEALITEVVKSE